MISSKPNYFPKTQLSIPSHGGVGERGVSELQHINLWGTQTFSPKQEGTKIASSTDFIIQQCHFYYFGEYLQYFKMLI